MQSGGHVAGIVAPRIGADQYDPAQHEKLDGGEPGARVMSGLVRDNLCFPFWGNPSEAEYKAGMTFHGKTGVVRWKRIAAPPVR